MQFQNILVTGGAGYVGCALVPILLKQGYNVTVYDALIFGDGGLPKGDPKLKIVKGDIRDSKKVFETARGHDAIIHLACIANDPSFELNPELGKSINYDCFEPMVAATREAGLRRFIYASTSSVYGVSDAPEVTEEHPLVPLTDYNKYKGMTEPLLLKYQAPDFTTVIIRPATVCGYSPRTRLDLSVNILTNHAINNRKITVFGGAQKRPNIHVDDIAELYAQLLTTPEKLIAGQTFNAACENHTIAQLATFVKKVVEDEMPELGEIPIEATTSNDMRSYHVTSAKIKRVLGYTPKRSIEDAVRGLCKAFKSGKLLNSMVDDVYYNVRMLKKIGFK